MLQYSLQLHHADSHLHCHKYTLEMLLAAFNQQYKHLTGTYEKKDTAAVVPQTIHSYSTCTDKCPLNATIILSLLNLFS